MWNLVSNATQTADLGEKPSLKLFASNVDHSGDHRQVLLSDGAIFHVSSFPPTENEVALSIRHLSRPSSPWSEFSLMSPMIEKEDLATNSFMDFDEAFADARGKQLNDHRRGFDYRRSCRTSEAPVHDFLPREDHSTTHSAPSPSMAKRWQQTDQARPVRRYYLDGGDDKLHPTSSRRSPEMETSGPTDFRGTHSERKEPNSNYKGRNDAMPRTGHGRVFRTVLYENAGENEFTKKPNSHRCEMHHQIRGQFDRDIHRYVRALDPPGFGDTYKNDTDVLSAIANALGDFHEDSTTTINGIIYIQAIDEATMGHLALKNLRVFRNLIGEEHLEKCRLLTTKWKSVPDAKATSREKTRGYCWGIPVNTYYNNSKGVLRHGINYHDPDARERSVLDTTEMTMDEIYEASHPRYHPYSLNYTSSRRLRASLESERTSTSAQADEQDAERCERLRGIERPYLARRRNHVVLSRQASANLAPRVASQTRITASPSRLSQAEEASTDDDLPPLISTNDLTPTAGGSQTQPLPYKIPLSDPWHVIENALESARASDGGQTPAGLISLARLESVLATEWRLSLSAISRNVSPPSAE